MQAFMVYTFYNDVHLKNAKPNAYETPPAITYRMYMLHLDFPRIESKMVKMGR